MSVKEVSVVDAKKMMSEGSVLIDVREKFELTMSGAVEGGACVPLRSLSIESLPADNNTSILFFCRSGNRSMSAAMKAKSLGYDNVFNVTGGMIGWKQAGLPTK